jgi:hypothetical protein
MIIKQNEYRILKNYAEIIIISETHGIFNVKIDLKDVEKVKKILWSINALGRKNGKKEFYAVNNKYGLLHRYLLDAQKGVFVDHKDGNTLDCRRKNIRLLTRHQNNMNKGIYNNNSSGHVGIIWYKKTKKWMAFIKINKIQINLGYFEKIEDAIEARRLAEIKYFGKYTRNYPLTNKG